MKLVAQKLRWLVLLLVAAVLLAVAPRPASAHEGHTGAQAPAASLTAGHPVATGELRLPEQRTAGWSRSCQGGSGNACCCGSRSAYIGGGKTPLVIAGGWRIPVALPVVRVAPLLAVAEPASQIPSSASPRAPPLFS